MSVNSSSNTLLFNNISVNLGESTFDLNTNLLQREDQPEDCFPILHSNTASDPIHIPSGNCYFYDYQQEQQEQNHLQPSVSHSSYINQSHQFLYSPISTSDDSICFSPAADSGNYYLRELNKINMHAKRINKKQGIGSADFIFLFF